MISIYYKSGEEVQIGDLVKNSFGHIGIIKEKFHGKMINYVMIIWLDTQNSMTYPLEVLKLIRRNAEKLLTWL